MKIILFLLSLLFVPHLIFSQLIKDEHTIEVYKIHSLDTDIDYDLLISSPKVMRSGLPVLYVLDPDYNFLQFILSYDSMIQQGKVQDVLIVGVGYGQNFLKREYGVLKDLTPTKMDPEEYNENIAVIPKDSALRYTGGATEFAAFLKKKLFPFIDDKFQTGGERLAYGNGHAGLFLCDLLSKEASLFTGYIISNPSLWWGDEYVIKNAHLNIPDSTRIFFSMGGKQEKKTISAATHFLALTKKIRWTSVWFPDDDALTSIPKGFRDGCKAVLRKN